MYIHSRLTVILTLLSVGIIAAVFVLQAHWAIRHSLLRENGPIAFGYGDVPICGDGMVTGAETCDDGNVVSGDGCSDVCAPESGYACPEAGAACTAVCGDGLLRTGELCDDGGVEAGDGCSALCIVEAGYSCTGEPSVCTDGCMNGVQSAEEECDDGNASNFDDCTNQCTIAVCGDGYVRSGQEMCDDGNAVSGDGCSALCTVESGYVCTGTEPTVCTTVCGDGMVTGAETCDDGNAVSGDGCSDVCAPESGYACPEPGAACTAVCGDGLLRTGELCDDGNAVSGDGCSPLCIVEAGYSCTGEPSVCTMPLSSSASSALSVIVSVSSSSVSVTGGAGVAGDYTFTPYPRLSNRQFPSEGCGNNVREPHLGEECDWGALNGPFSPCTSTCRHAVCGDGMVYPDMEECEPLTQEPLPSCGGRMCDPTTCQWVFLPMCSSDQHSLLPMKTVFLTANMVDMPFAESTVASVEVADSSWLVRWLETILHACASFVRVLLGTERLT